MLALLAALTFLFPVAGATTYQDDFGQPRAGGPHQGNDLMAAKKTPVIAVEGGRVEFWTTSASAGCMLYLYGDSGTM
jgi:murein DD-endopeptidase MepM/ murein hydrolase activator NlpD